MKQMNFLYKTGHKDHTYYTRFYIWNVKKLRVNIPKHISSKNMPTIIPPIDEEQRYINL